MGKLYDKYIEIKTVTNELTGRYFVSDGWLRNEIINLDKEEYPSVFYIGGLKSASQSIVYGFDNRKVVHWHDPHHVKTYHKNISRYVTSVEDEYDCARITSDLINQKVLIIESYRESISRGISMMFQNLLSGNPWGGLMEFDLINGTIEECYKHLKDKINLFIEFANQCPYCKNIYDISDFDCNQGYFYKEYPLVKFLFLVYENITDWEKTIHGIGYTDFKMKKINTTTGRMNFVKGLSTQKYDEIFLFFKQNYRPDQDTLEKSTTRNKFFNLLYTPEQQQKIIAKYS